MEEMVLAGVQQRNLEGRPHERPHLRIRLRRGCSAVPTRMRWPKMGLWFYNLPAPSFDDNLWPDTGRMAALVRKPAAAAETVQKKGAAMRNGRSGHIGGPRPRGEYLAAAQSRRQPFHSANDQRNNNYVNQITQRSVAGGTAVVFEYYNNSSPLPGNGNLTYDGTLNYQYDALNRLIAVNRVSDGAAIAAYVYDAGNRRVRKTVTNGGLAGNIPNGTTDSCWFGWQTMEERNPSGGTDTPTKQYVWGNYIDECLQLNLLAVAGPQQLAVGVYYPLQDTLYRTMALVNSSGTPVEACDTDAYGNTTIFTGPGPDGTWFTDDDLQSSYGANNIIYCGYRYDAETENYYVRNRYYSPTLGRWLTRDPIGYQGGIKLYGYVGGRVLSATDSSGHEWIKVPGIQLCEAYIPESLLYSLHFAHAWVSIAGVGSWGFHPGPAAAGNIGVIVPQPRLIKRDWNYGKFPDKGAPGWQNGYKVCYPLSVHSCRCDPNKAAAGVRAALAAERKKPAPDYSVEFFDCYDWAISTIVKGAMAGCKKGNYWYGLPKPDIKINGATYPAWPLPVIA